MNVKNHITLEHLAHVCMVALAAASTANIGRWLDNTGENAVTAWGVAVAVGVMVVTLSVILSKIDRTVDPQLFNMMTIAAAAMCILSGTLQTMAYAAHINPWAAAALGYLLPLCGELLVGVAMSLYSTYQDAMVLRTANDDADRQIEKQIAAQMQTLELSADAIDYMQKRLGTLARRRIDAVIDRSLARSAQPEAQELNAVSPKLSAAPAQTEGQSAAATPSIDEANAARQDQIAQRRRQLAHLLHLNPDAQTGELSEQLDVSPNTIRSDKRAIEAEPHLYLNGTAPAAA